MPYGRYFRRASIFVTIHEMDKSVLVNDAGECEDNAESILNISNRATEHIYCKHDGSLDDGFEVVTHPMTLEHHCSVMPWESVLSKLRSMGYLSHQANTCGFHIHMNRNSLGKTESEQDGNKTR